MVNAITLTQDLVRRKSVTPLDDGALGLMRDALEPLGFNCTDLPFEDIQNLFARRGTTGPHFCFAGHTDVVPAGDETAWTHPPFSATIADGKMYGRGTADMKGNVAAFVEAAASFITDHPNHPGSISLLITGDEEADAINGTVRVLDWMAQNNHTPDFCVVGEPSNPEAMGDEVKIGRRGSLSGAITVTGKQGHIAYPSRADNPIPKMAKLISALAETSLDTGTEHFPASSLQFSTVDVGNRAENVIPGAATAKFNIRYNDTWTPETLESHIRAILDQTGAAYAITFKRGGNVFLTQPGAYTDIVRNCVEKVTGRVPAMTTTGGTSDARFISRHCPVVECGMINKTIHQIDEHIVLNDLEMLVKIYRLILDQFFGVAG